MSTETPAFRRGPGSCPTCDEIRSWLTTVETPLGDLHNSLECLLAMVDKHELQTSPGALCWLVYVVQDSANAVDNEWRALWKRAFGRDPDRRPKS